MIQIEESRRPAPARRRDRRPGPASGSTASARCLSLCLAREAQPLSGCRGPGHCHPAKLRTGG
eukprot:2725421-Rhodomonas_salina.1